MDIRIAGIPAIARVTHYVNTRGNYSSQAMDPDEYYGFKELEFDVLDSRGRPAKWLERKLERPAVFEAVQAEVWKAMQ